jgi:hypothetical protein
MVVARMLTVKGFSEQSLEKTMRAAWNAVKEVIFRPIEKKFIVQAFCLGDWNRIMQEGPWMFQECALMLEEFNGATNALSVMPKALFHYGNGGRSRRLGATPTAKCRCRRRRRPPG